MTFIKLRRPFFLFMFFHYPYFFSASQFGIWGEIFGFWAQHRLSQSHDFWRVILSLILPLLIQRVNLDFNCVARLASTLYSVGKDLALRRIWLHKHALAPISNHFIHRSPNFTLSHKAAILWLHAFFDLFSMCRLRFAHISTIYVIVACADAWQTERWLWILWLQEAWVAIWGQIFFTCGCPFKFLFDFILDLLINVLLFLYLSLLVERKSIVES